MTWFELLVKSAIIVLVVTALGVGPAAWLASRRRYPWFAIAPAWGLAIGAVLLTTAADVMTMRRAAWLVLLPALAASIVTAALAWRRGRLGVRPRRRASALLVAALLVALVVASLPLGTKRSRGPLGYVVNDATGSYPAQEIGIRGNSLGERGP